VFVNSASRILFTLDLKFSALIKVEYDI
jgi:hypothetical protein